MANNSNQHKAIASDERFVELYFLFNFNATKAYLSIHPESSDSTARTMASRLIRTSNVKELIARKELEIREKSNIDLSYLVESLKKVVDECKDEKIERNKQGQIMSKPDRGSLIKAVDTLAKLGGFYTQKMDITTNGESVNTITIKYKDIEDDIEEDEDDIINPSDESDDI